MLKKTVTDLEDEFNDSNLREKFRRLFALSLYIKRALTETAFKPSHEFQDLIYLTDLGKDLVSDLEKNKDYSTSEINLAIFAVFGWHDLYVDLLKTDPEPIKDFINKEIINNNFVYPWIFELYLYNKYDKSFPKNIDRLSPEQTAEFLKYTPKGVFQLDEYVIGPFGITKSFEKRFMPPTSNLDLYHCEDPGCDGTHDVDLSQGENNFRKIIQKIISENDKNLGYPSHWSTFFLKSINFDRYDINNANNFSCLLFDCFSEIELKKILQKLIELHSSRIRKKFQNKKHFKAVFNGSANMIVDKLNKVECCQLILTETNENIIECIEKLIDLNDILIPPTEIRCPVHVVTGFSMFDEHWECSKFGVRPLSNIHDLPLLRLKDLIWEIYSDEIDELEWILELENGNDLSEAVERCLYNDNPQELIKKLIFYKKENLSKAFNYLKYGNFDYTHVKQEFMINKILWKLGFSINIYPDYLKIFWERTEIFIDTVQRQEGLSEREKEEIRSAGVNYFISLEEILDYSLSFMTWGFLKDHFSDTKFKFNFDEAREYMADELNSPNKGSIKFDPEKNTLYPLIQGFKILADKCNEFIKNKNNYARQQSELPFYYEKTDLLKFLYLHKKMVLDLKEDDSKKMIDFLYNITTSLEKSNIMSIRNKIDHKRKEFPSKHQIINSVNIVTDLFRIMEQKGIIPLVFLPSKIFIDKFNRKKQIFNTYNKDKITFHLPFESSMKSNFLNEPLIIIPSLHLDNSNEFVRFKLVESSEYVELWKDYPKK